MKSTIVFLSTIFALNLMGSLFAHEGHNHHDKMEITGVVQKGKTLSLKFVQEGELFKFYPLGLDGKAIPLSEIKISGSASPRKLKEETLQFSSGKDFFSTKYSVKTFTTLNILVNYREEKNSLSFKVDSE